MQSRPNRVASLSTPSPFQVATHHPTLLHSAAQGGSLSSVHGPSLVTPASAVLTGPETGNERLSGNHEDESLLSRMFSVPSASMQSNAQIGPDLTEVQTEGIGFQAIAGETKLQLLPSPWPSNALPKPTSTLLSIAPHNELVAAAGPSTLVIATTPNIRDSYLKGVATENKTKTLSPELTIDIPRVSHVAFSSDENYLTICADEGGGLSVYDVQELKKGNTRSAFELGTNGTAVRALVPNPAAEFGHVTAVVLANGQLLLANLKERQIASGKTGPVLKEGVSCMSWSAKGKQLVAGLGNGTAVQMDPEGEVKAEIPRPSILNGDLHVSGISWLNNDLFLIIYTPSKPEHEGVPDSVYLLVTRQPKTTNYMFQKVQEPVGTFGMNRSPPHHFNTRLRDFPPNLTDIILLSSTGSGDIGMITCSKTPLSSEQSAANTANVYTTTSIANDSRRAQLPVNDEPDEMSDGAVDTSPIGMVLDLSSKEPVKRPIPTEEIEISSTPLPALMVLNNQGILSIWWFVYSESVRQGTVYPGLVAAASSQGPIPLLTQQQAPAFGTPAFVPPAIQPQPSPFASALVAHPNSSAFGVPSQPQSAFGVPTNSSVGTFGKPATPAFGTPSGLGAFGSTAQPTSAPAFGGSTLPNGSQFGKPAFGEPALPNAARTAFGTAGGLGSKTSVWGTPTGPASSIAAADKPANPFSNTASTSPFGTIAGSIPSSGDKPFSAFGGNASSTSPFAVLGGPQKPSVFGTNTAAAQTSSSTTAFGTPSPFGQTRSTWGADALASGNRPQSPLAKQSFGMNTTSDTDMEASAMDEDVPGSDKAKHISTFPGTGSSGLQLGSTFEADKTVKETETKQPEKLLFGSAFGDALGAPITAPATPMKQEPKSSASSETLSTAPATSVKPPTTNPSEAPVRGPPEQEAKTVEHEPIEDAPLPPSPILSKPLADQTTTSLPPLDRASPEPADKALSPAGSPPVDLGEPSSSPLSSAGFRQEEDNDSNDDDDDYESPPVAYEMDDVPLPPDFTATTIPQSEPTWNFPPLAAKNHAPTSDKAKEPAPQRVPPARSAAQDNETPAKATPHQGFFSPPPASQVTQVSPRSPSPRRDTPALTSKTSLATPMASLQQHSTTPLMSPPVKFMPRSAAPAFPPMKSSASQSPALTSPPRRHDERSALIVHPEEAIDNTDELIQEELSQPVEPSRDLAPFLAHQDYVGRVGGEGVAAQAERLYRDMNSMVDTLGLNARSLASFVKGHSELFPDGGRERADLEDDDWCLIEIEDLGVVQKNLGEQLENDRPQNVKDKLTQLREVQRDLIKLRARHHDLQRMMQSYSNANEHSKAGDRSEPLTSEQSVVIMDLRKAFTTLQKQLVEAEENVSLLKARVAAIQATATGAADSSKIPTVEAVLNTIAKMTRMIEQKSGDIDVLEAQMRRMKFRPRTSNRFGTPSNLEEALGRLSIGSGGRRGGSPFATPPSSKSKMVKEGTYQLTYSPDSSDDESTALRRSLRSALGDGTTAVAKLTQLSDEELVASAARYQRRQKVLQLLKKKVCEKGVKTKSTGP